MDFIEQLSELGQKVKQNKSHIISEEAAKTALILPFIRILGYDTTNPQEVVPEFNADVGIKKGEKVDYAIIIENQPMIIIECKHHGENLDNFGTQLHRYFAETESRIGVLTNGIIYRFYSDLDQKNIMDSKPFLEFNITEIEAQNSQDLIQELKKFQKDSFDIDHVMDSACDLRYLKEFKELLTKEFESPSENFVRFCTNKIYKGRSTSRIIDQFTSIIKKSIDNHIEDKIQKRFKYAQEKEESLALENATSASVEKSINEDSGEAIEQRSRVVTTEEELEGFYLIKSILRPKIDSKRLCFKDTINYFAINLDDNIRKPICRLWLNSERNKYIGIFDEAKKETKHKINHIDDCYKYSEQLFKRVLLYDNEVKEDPSFEASNVVNLQK